MTRNPQSEVDRFSEKKPAHFWVKINSQAFNAPSRRLQTHIESPCELASNLTERRRNHRRRTPSGISLNPELGAVMPDRPNRLSVKKITLAVATNFLPNRRVSLSSVYRWRLANREIRAPICTSRL